MSGLAMALVFAGTLFIGAEVIRFIVNRTFGSTGGIYEEDLDTNYIKRRK